MKNGKLYIPDGSVLHYIAVLLGLSLKNKAVAEQPSEQVIPSEAPRSYKG